MITKIHYIFCTEKLNENYTASAGFLREYKFYD